VRQRADRYSVIGKPKSDAGECTVPLTPIVVNTLREWKLVCPKSKHGLGFPTGSGNIEGIRILCTADLPLPASKLASPFRPKTKMENRLGTRTANQ
jgi:hypothetical protein